MDAVIAALVGLISGCIGSLIAPWVHWGIEKKRLKLQARRQLISEAREYITSKQFGGSQFHGKTWFPQLRHSLSAGTVEEVENFREYASSASDPAEVREALRRKLLTELEEIERRWGLI